MRLCHSAAQADETNGPAAARAAGRRPSATSGGEFGIGGWFGRIERRGHDLAPAEDGGEVLIAMVVQAVGNFNGLEGKGKGKDAEACRGERNKKTRRRGEIDEAIVEAD